VRKPAWQKFPGSSYDGQLIQVKIVRKGLTRNPSGEAGCEFRFTAQSINVWLPRIANTIVFMSSIGTDLITIAFVPIFQSASTCVSFSWPLGFVYTLSEYWAAKHRSGNVGRYLELCQK
jgi:hypothetical protein